MQPRFFFFKRKFFYKNVLKQWENTNDEEEMMILKQYAEYGLKTIINYASKRLRYNYIILSIFYFIKYIIPKIC